MSILRSYINKNNTIISNSYVNTGRNPVIELNFGASDLIVPNYGYTRFIFDLDLSLLRQNISSGVISTGCTSAMTHTLKMTNTSSFDNELLNSFMSNERRRATSFDLILFRIPQISGNTGGPQYWDEGVGYDYNDFNIAQNSANGGASPLTYVDSRAYSTRPSNWYQTTTISGWSQNGIYNNKNEGTVNYSGLTIVARQHFELGNEDLNMDMSSEINGVLNGSITGVTGIVTRRTSGGIVKEVPYINMVVWNPNYPTADVEFLSQSVRLQDFQFPFLYQQSQVYSKIVVEDE